MLVLGIETSCDETSVAVVRNGKEVLSNIVSSQIEVHKQFGGVVPEVASRMHVEVFPDVLRRALEEANVTLADIDMIAVTEGPGLIGALLVGINAAKALAFANDIPLIGVDHVAGHMYANNLTSDLEFPLLSLVVSGGHTELVIMRDNYDFEVIGRTLDDAIGEAYDKVARVCGLPYPGGPSVDRLAQQGIDEYKFKRSMLDNDDFDFSFSGIKSAVINLNHNYEQRGEHVDINNLCASFQECVSDIVFEKTRRALLKYDIKNLLIAGGVAANSAIRKKVVGLKDKGYNVSVPNLMYCTDNAAMIAAAGYFKYQKTKQYSNFDMNGYSTK